MSTNAIKIKGGRTGLWVILDKSFPFSAIEQEIQEKLDRHLNFFPNGTVINIVANGFGEKARQRIKEMFVEHGIHVNFAEKEPAKTIARNNAEEQFGFQMRERTKGYEPEGGMLGNQPIASDAERHASNAVAREENMLVIHRTIRGGEEIVADGSILICGNVHAGANIIAGGNIDIRGRCQGVVHAGVHGDTNAIIIADRMQPIQIRIANLIARSPDEVVIQIKRRKHP